LKRPIATLTGLVLIATAAPIASAQGLQADARSARPTSQTARALAARHVGAEARAQPRADSRPTPKSPSPSARRSPERLPLTAAPDGSGEGEEEPRGTPDSAAAQLDPLVVNGLVSPLCRGALGGGQLSGQSRSNCETSGFVAAGPPTGDYGIDVHIDTGVLGLSTGGLLSIVQDIFITPVWTALVWAVHALVVMLEWCFTIDLLDSPSVGLGLARALRAMQAAFTQPWLASVLAIGGVLAAYNGLIRRRVADAVGQVLLVIVMIAGGTWVTLDPLGTVGVLGGWANQAGLGTLAVTIRGTPAGAGQALADSMGALFSTTVEVPWCYLEFGDVGWCRNPARVDPRLRRAAHAIAAGELAAARCEHESAGSCAARGGPQVQALEHSARLLQSARSNGAFFLALPANAAQRNSINDHESLLWAICQSDDATDCRGATAAEAEFRTDHGTWPRVAGLVLIVAGVLGMLLLLGFLALRLLAAAVISLLYLMLAPAVVLAPALGDGGRAVFRGWASQLLGAVLSKLLFSFLLGAILAVLNVLESLEGLGWWTQWLLMSSFWWGAYLHRHRALQISAGAAGRARDPERHGFTRRGGGVLDAPRGLIDGARAARERIQRRRANRRSEADLRAAPKAMGSAVGFNRRAGRGELSHDLPPGPARAAPTVHRGSRTRLNASGNDEQATRLLSAELHEARAAVHGAAEARARLSALRDQLTRVTTQHREALAAGDGRRAATLEQRSQRIEADIERGRADAVAARRLVVETRSGQDGAAASARLGEQKRFLDAQAALAPSTRAVRAGAQRRDYAALAGLAGYAPHEYKRLDAPAKRQARLEIDRELSSRTAVRRESTAREVSDPIGREVRDRRERRHGPATPSDSSVMADIREVAARRKRQLGRGRP
jgi:hypothetical protein